MQLLSPVKKIKTPIFVTTHKLRGITEKCLVQKILRYILHAKPHSFTAFTRGLPFLRKNFRETLSTLPSATVYR